MAADRTGTDLEDQKGQLIARSGHYRQALAEELQEVNHSMSWVPRAAHLAKTASPLLVMVAPVVGWLLLRRKPKAVPAPPAARSSGLLGKAWRAIQVFQQVFPVVLPVVQGFRHARSRD
jgi:hypothetical protein